MAAFHFMLQLNFSAVPLSFLLNTFLYPARNLEQSNHIIINHI